MSTDERAAPDTEFVSDAQRGGGAREISSSGAEPSAPSVASGRILEAHLLEMVFPSQTNHYGTLFGGQAFAFMDKAAFVAASRFTRLPMVTASSERIDFHAPVRQGQVADLRARVTATGRTSVTVTVELHAEDLLTGERHLATRGRFVLVAVDSAGNPVPVPALENDPSVGGSAESDRLVRPE